MKTLNLSTEEIKLIDIALNFVYITKLKSLETNRRIMNDEEVNSLLANANKFSDLQDKIFNSK